MTRSIRTGRHAKGMLRPHMWVTGPDPDLHKMYIPYLRAKAQANFRDEGWDMTFEDWADIWHGIWDQRGRQVDCLCITRIDESEAWSPKNCEIIERREQLIRRGLAQRGKKYRPRKPKND